MDFSRNVRRELAAHEQETGLKFLNVEKLILQAQGPEQTRSLTPSKSPNKITGIVRGSPRASKIVSTYPGTHVDMGLSAGMSPAIISSSVMSPPVMGLVEGKLRLHERSRMSEITRLPMAHPQMAFTGHRPVSRMQLSDEFSLKIQASPAATSFLMGEFVRPRFQGPLMEIVPPASAERTIVAPGALGTSWKEGDAGDISPDASAFHSADDVPLTEEMISSGRGTGAFPTAGV